MALFHRILFLLLIATSSIISGTYNTVVKAFEDAPEYVTPLSTLLGTINGNGWNQQSSLGRDFKFKFALPITVAVINDKDRSYSGTYVPEKYATLVAEHNLSAHHLISQDFTTPTILGKANFAAPTLYDPDVDMNGVVIDSTEVLLSDGVESLSKFNWLPAPALQFQTEALYSSLTFRYLFFPNEKIKVHLPGVSFRHDIKSLFPEMPLSVTLFTSHSFQAVNWEPGENITGKLEMRGNTGFSGITIGKKLNEVVDIMVESGYEYSSLSTGGEAIIYEDETLEVPEDTITPGMTLEGRRSFKAGLHITFTPGSKKVYGVSGSGGAGTQQHFTFTPLFLDFSNRKED